MDLHHPILREFPEHREIIRRLKGSDDHFRKMFDEYHRLDDAVYRIEEEIDFATDQEIDRKSTRLNSSHGYISYAVFCLKKKHTLLGSRVHSQRIPLRTPAGFP